MYTGGFLRKTIYINSVFTLAVVLSHPPMSLFYTSGYLNEPSVKKRLFTHAVFLTPDQNSTTEASSIGGQLGGPKIAKYKRKGFVYLFL